MKLKVIEAVLRGNYNLKSYTRCNMSRMQSM